MHGLLCLENFKYFGIALGLCGLLGLTFLVPEYENILPQEISEKIVGKKIRVTGEVKNFFVAKGNAFFEIGEVVFVKAVIFRPRPEQLAELRKAKKIVVSGTVSVHQGVAGIIADKVRPA